MTEQCLINGADIKYNLYLLFIAIRKSNLKMVEDILKSGADVNVINNLDRWGRTPLHFAAYHGRVEIAKLLIKYGANLNVKSTEGRSPIVEAFYNRDTEMAELLLTNGADIKDDPKVLCSAVAYGHLKLVEDLLKNGGDVNMIDSSDSWGQTPLHVAAVFYGRVEIAKLLIKYGANLNVKCTLGKTSIVAAISAHNTEMVELLLTNGADINEDLDTKLGCGHPPTTKILKQHIAKVKAAGLYVSERNLQWIINDYEIKNFLNECEAEIQIMKSEKIDNSCASFYDILIKNTSALAKNESVVQALQSDDYKTKLPIYASMIDSRFRRGLEIEGLLEQVRNQFLRFLFQSLPELPVLCTEKILSYLSNKDLRMLLVACELFNEKNI